MSDIIIEEVLLTTKKSLKYSLISNLIEKIILKNSKYGTHLTGILKFKFYNFFKKNFQFIIFKNCHLWLDQIKINQ